MCHHVTEVILTSPTRPRGWIQRQYHLNLSSTHCLSKQLWLHTPKSDRSILKRSIHHTLHINTMLTILGMKMNQIIQEFIQNIANWAALKIQLSWQGGQWQEIIYNSFFTSLVEEGEEVETRVVDVVTVVEETCLCVNPDMTSLLVAGFSCLMSRDVGRVAFDSAGVLGEDNDLPSSFCNHMKKRSQWRTQQIYYSFTFEVKPAISNHLQKIQKWSPGISNPFNWWYLTHIHLPRRTSVNTISLIYYLP